ncbi:MAG: oligoendopeptidase F [Tissierellia bacterium]|nr:oligoendopeptidase F [Tissierellia bacterium]
MDILKTVPRTEVEEKYTWDLSALFSTKEDYDVTLQETEALVDKFVKDYKGKLNNADTINSAIDDSKVFMENLYQLNSYASLPVSADANNRDSIMTISDFSLRRNAMTTKISFFNVELLNNDFNVLKEAAKDEENNHFLTELMEEKEHMLGEEAENVLAQLQMTLNSANDIYDSAKLKDMKFPDIELNGESYPLSYNIFEGMLDSDPNTELRRKAYDEFYSVLDKYKNVTGANYLNHVRTEKTMATLRGFDSVIDYLLFEQRIPRDVYNRQIDIIMSDLAPHMRKYARLVKEANGLDKMTYADLKVDIDNSMNEFMSVEAAEEIIKNGLSVLGDEYTEILDRAFSERWIDYVNNTGKSTGAFCASPYGAHPFILVSWSGKMYEAMTLAHELGHAGHFYLSGKNQNILNTRPSLYFVEAPSTTNELIMANQMLKNAKDAKERRYHLSNIISKTYYHNFVTHLLEAAYQREVYYLIDANKSFTADDLSEIYYNVLKEFWGDEVEITKGAELTWMRQPHYYMGLYPYTYSAGLTIGTQVSQMILDEGQTAVDRWIDTLKLGGVKDAVGLAQNAGVDITTDKPLKDTIAYIGSIIDEIEEITNELK